MPRVTFVTRQGKSCEFDVKSGDTLLEIAWRHDLDMEGACEGSMACSTCHVIVEAQWFDRLPPASEDEEDMLDLAWGVAPTSRLGCQVVVTDALDGMVVSLPRETTNQMEE
ncbi:MAG: 2Fe-2S iron-sulfur cluster binding domain-containing protein [Rhodospirillales bacterium]|nr:2Fe-2S iron-sulfur cluster binding domain-containing protein [Rhodospirillales bacterium]